MGAIDEALRIYGPGFGRIHGSYLQHGYCYSEPDMLALARPCLRENHLAWCSPKDADAWWVELVVGRDALRVLFDHIPFALGYVGWAREFKGKPEPRFYNFSKLKEKLNYGR